MTGQKVSATFLTHSRRAERSIGFACRHFGEEAFEREDKLKPKFSREAKQEKEVILYTKNGRQIHECSEKYDDKDDMGRAGTTDTLPVGGI